jgi:hypothetical protein
MKLGGIARAAPATKQLSNNADPPSGSPAHSWLDTYLVVRELDGCDREVSKLHCRKGATSARLLKKRPPPLLNFDAEAVGRSHTEAPPIGSGCGSGRSSSAPPDSEGIASRQRESRHQPHALVDQLAECP